MDYAGINGFLGTRASIMLDVVFVAMFAVLPILAWSIWLVKARRAYALHKRVQLLLATVLLIAVTLFEVDLRMLTYWRERAEASPYYTTLVFPSLYIHLLFAVPTALIWTFVVVQALRKIPSPPTPSPYSPRHKLWGWIAVIEMAGTAVTGWIFYYLAFVA